MKLNHFASLGLAAVMALTPVSVFAKDTITLEKTKETTKTASDDWETVGDDDTETTSDDVLVDDEDASEDGDDVSGSASTWFSNLFKDTVDEATGTVNDALNKVTETVETVTADDDIYYAGKDYSLESTNYSKAKADISDLVTKYNGKVVSRNSYDTTIYYTLDIPTGNYTQFEDDLEALESLHITNFSENTPEGASTKYHEYTIYLEAVDIYSDAFVTDFGGYLMYHLAKVYAGCINIIKALLVVLVYASPLILLGLIIKLFCLLRKKK
jgi:hypothetical protein